MVQEIERTVFGNKSKAKYLKQVLGFSLCCLCRGVPSIELSYDLGGFRKIEMYCDSCASQLWERDDPEDKNLLAQKYGCVAVSELPKTPGYKEGKDVIS